MAPRKSECGIKSVGENFPIMKADSGNEAEGSNKKVKTETGSNTGGHQGKASTGGDQVVLLHWLLSDDAFAPAYPPIEAGKGELNLPPQEQS